MIEYAQISLPQDIGEIIRLERKELGWSQTELAQRGGCSQRFVSECERGKQSAEIGKVLQLLNALGLAVRISGRRTPEQSREMVDRGIDAIAETLERPTRKQRRLSDYLETS